MECCWCRAGVDGFDDDDGSANDATAAMLGVISGCTSGEISMPSCAACLTVRALCGRAAICPSMARKHCVRRPSICLIGSRSAVCASSA